MSSQAPEKRGISRAAPLREGKPKQHMSEIVAKAMNTDVEQLAFNNIGQRGKQIKDREEEDRAIVKAQRVLEMRKEAEGGGKGGTNLKRTSTQIDPPTDAASPSKSAPRKKVKELEPVTKPGPKLGTRPATATVTSSVAAPTKTGKASKD